MFRSGRGRQLYSLVVVGVVVGTLLFLGPVLETFPQAALAAVVIWAAVKLVDVAEFSGSPGSAAASWCWRSRRRPPC